MLVAQQARPIPRPVKKTTPTDSMWVLWLYALSTTKNRPNICKYVSIGSYMMQPMLAWHRSDLQEGWVLQLEIGFLPFLHGSWPSASCDSCCKKRQDFAKSGTSGTFWQNPALLANPTVFCTSCKSQLNTAHLADKPGSSISCKSWESIALPVCLSWITHPLQLHVISHNPMLVIKMSIVINMLLQNATVDTMHDLQARSQKQQVWMQIYKSKWSPNQVQMQI